MKVVLVVIVLVNAVFGFDKQFESDWKKFKSSHGKNYANQLDPLRAEIFRKEDAEIRAHNKRSSSFKRAHNFFSDLVSIMTSFFNSIFNDTSVFDPILSCPLK